MSSRWLHVVSVLLVAVACSYQDVKGDRRVLRTFTVSSVTSAPLELVLVPEDCPTERIVVKAGVTGAQSRHRADLACLGALPAGGAIKLEQQREKQGCIPGKVYYDLLGDCELGPLVLTSTGTRCTKP